MKMSQTTDNSASPAQPLAGEVCSQYIRCGKAGCRCQSGQLHGPYYYRIWREGTHVHKVYVPPAEVEQVKAACDAYRKLTRSLRSVKQAQMQLTRSIEKEWHRTQRMIDVSDPPIIGG